MRADFQGPLPNLVSLGLHQRIMAGHTRPLGLDGSGSMAQEGQ